MKRLVVVSLLLVGVACAPQSPPPATAAPPPAAAAAPPPSAAPASFDGSYAGTATLGVSGASSFAVTNPVCVNERPLNMTITNGYAVISYKDYKTHTLHYRGPVDPAGKIKVSHLNRDGSRSVFTLQISDNGVSGQMLRGRCWYSVAMSRA